MSVLQFASWGIYDELNMAELEPIIAAINEELHPRMLIHHVAPSQLAVYYWERHPAGTEWLKQKVYHAKKLSTACKVCLLKHDGPYPHREQLPPSYFQR